MENIRLGEHQTSQSRASNISWLEHEINERKAVIAQRRATGRTNRILNELVERLFDEPIGTKIAVKDHYWGENAGKVGDKWVVDSSHHEIGSTDMRNSAKQADMALLKMIRRRLETEYPNIKVSFDIKSYPYTVTRETPTLKEMLENEISCFEQMLQEEKDNIAKEFVEPKDDSNNIMVELKKIFE